MTLRWHFDRLRTNWLLTKFQYHTAPILTRGEAVSVLENLGELAQHCSRRQRMAIVQRRIQEAEAFFFPWAYRG